MSSDDESTRAAIDAAVRDIAHYPTDYVAAQVFNREGEWAGQGGGGFLARLLGRGGDSGGPAQPDRFNLLVLTRDRVLLHGVKPRRGSWRATYPIGDWPIDAVRVRGRDEYVRRPRDHEGDLRGGVDTIKVTIHIKPENRALKLEGTVWGGSTITRTTVDALVAATCAPAARR